MRERTGHFDRNGVEMREGDIFHDYGIFLGDKFCIVERRLSWGKPGNWQWFRVGESGYWPLENSHIKYEVVGNKYDNPDLYEKAKKILEDRDRRLAEKQGTKCHKEE